MTKIIAVRATFLAMVCAIVVVSSGCPRQKSSTTPVTVAKRKKPRNIKGFHCGPHHTPQTYQIDLTHDATVLADSDDSVIFVCEKDSVIWHVADGFNETIALGSSGPAVFKDGPTSITSVAGETAPLLVKPPEHAGRAYEYTINMLDRDNKVIATLDPHIIPMGK